MLLRSIRSRIFGLVVATVVPFIALMVAGLWNHWRTEHAAAIQRSLNEARLISAKVDDYISNFDNLLIGLSKAVSWDPADTNANDALLRKVKAEVPPYLANLLVYAADGTNIGTSADPAQGRPNGKGRTNFEHTRSDKRRTIGDVVFARVMGEWVIPISHPIFDESGRMRAILTAGTLLSELQKFLTTPGLPAGSVVLLINERNIVVTRNVNGPHWFGRDLSESKSLARHLATKELSKVMRWSDGVERITGSATATKVPWLVSVGLPTEVATESVRWRLGWASLFIVIALLTAFGIAWMLSGHIARPLRQLGKDVSAFAAGNLRHRSKIGTPDEAGQLAAAFNHMAASLEQRDEDAQRATGELRQANDTLAAVIDASPVAIVCSDLQRRIVIWSRAAEQMFGYTADEALGKMANVVPPKSADESLGLFKRALSGETIRDLHLKRMRKDGSLIDVRAAAAPMYNPDGTVRGVARAYEDITDRVRAEEQLKRIAHYDQLTGLPNRLTLQKELGRLLSGGGTSTAIALFDLDGFKDVNDTLGHSTGDQLLIEVGYRLAEVAGSRGQVCRLGGDEFVVIFPDCGNPIVIGEIVDSMLKRLSDPFKVNDHILHVGGSTGVAIAPSDGTTVDELIANADLALYQAKSDGGRVYRFFLPVLRAQAQARRSLDLELRRAYAEDEFELYFQPQIRLADGAVVGAEALLRWRHPVAGILAPGAFIDTLAASAIAPQVSRWILRTACTKAAGWRARGLPLGRIGVNLFPSQLGDETLLNDIDDALRDTGLPAEALELEITENVALNFEDEGALQKIADRGVKLALDDFGTGYASLSYLTRFPLARIKIDRSFVGKLTDDAGDAAIVRSLIAMAHNLGLEVIAEGVETTAQAAFLINETCEEAQGYLYAKPLPAVEFEGYLRTRPLVQTTDSGEKRLNRDGKFQRRAGKPRGRRRLPTA
ncbi:MAG: bifunctional diguanylate cyclase/phosphodiesterase [Xanthobacteraceae bacterium]